jgi:5-oxoprolinase (ATP-hydrolysing)
MADDRWQFWLDVGGTFTDCLAREPSGKLLRRKVLSSAVTKGQGEWDAAATELRDPARQEPAGFWAGYRLRLSDGELVVSDSRPGEILVAGRNAERHRGRSLQGYELVSPEEAPLLAIRLFLGLRLDQPIPPCVVRLGTTRGTNALLTRRGAKTALVTTQGHADVLCIGYQNRPKLFELAIKKPEPLFADVAEIDERIAADGSVLKAPDPEQVRAELTRLKASGTESLAICLLNAYANPAHEQLVGQLAREIGFTEISLSHQVSSLMKIVPRGDTTVVDAYLNPVLQTYVARLAAALPGSDLCLMTSAGGLVSAANFTGKDSILSGPAGGVVGFSKVAQAAGFERAIGFDMGGTSTDVSRFEGRYEYEYETEKAGVRIVAPMLAIETVAAGGGSICKWDGVKLVVGPDSAGADPGPACYGRGGPLTITDCNFYLGRILPEHFPFPLDRAAVEARLAEVADSVRTDSSRNATEGVSYSAAELAEGFVRIANTHMAQAIRSISIAKGYDVRRYALVAFGAAAPQHACAVARELGITQVVIHPDAGVLSALGMGLADVARHRSVGIYRLLDKTLDELPELFSRLQRDAQLDLAAEGAGLEENVHFQRFLELRYQETDAALAITYRRGADHEAIFERKHRKLYGYVHAGRRIEAVAGRVTAVKKAGFNLPSSQHGDQTAASPDSQRWIYAKTAQVATVYQRDKLCAGMHFPGPAIIADTLTTTMVDDGWHAYVLTGGDILLLGRGRGNGEGLSTVVDPVMLELFNNRFTAIATQMGITLRNTAMSVNVKERLDFSCAVFTPEGDLVVNAPHIPVHLGAMSETVKRIIADNPQLKPGDVYVTNDPYRGGSHLPDVTVVTPVFDGSRLVFFAASRAHHAEIGGITPGSVPPFSKNLAEEGVLIRNFKLLDAGISRFDELRALLTSGPFPSRSPETNLADITAQLAANHQGAEDLRRMIAQFSLAVVEAYMRHIQDAAERKMRQTFCRMKPGRREFGDHLDDGTPICVAITISGDSATIDFTGTGPVSQGNLNANRAIVSAAVTYVLRLLVGEDIPLNQGVLAPVKIVLPECILNPPERPRPEDCPAVVGGNVETSQRVVDVLLGALGLAAASQGTMNNVLFGDATFGYYETICGGSGATANADGADAVQIHMTNTRLTDPEVLEARNPVRLREFSIRRGSGGAGKHRGGDGTRRVIEFLNPLTLSILSQRRGPYPPYGLAGGQPGALGKNTLTRADGRVETLPHASQVEVQPGDILTIETPGGGGYGSA